MLSLVGRVAARHILAAFIPDKFFKGYEAEFKKLMVEPLGKVLEQVPVLIYDRVIPLLNKFMRELTDLAPNAHGTLKTRFDKQEQKLSELATSYRDVARAVRAPYPLATTFDRIVQHIELRVDEKLEKDFTTLGKALKHKVTVDRAKVEALASRALKAASPEVKSAIDDDNLWGGPRLELKYDFLRQHVDGSVARLVKKEKVETPWGEFFAFIAEVLAANFTAEEQRLSEFDVNGMKVVINDASIAKYEQEDYVKYLDAAYQRLKRKRLGKAWYGTVYIECEQCGGVNKNTGGGVGGHFNIGKDHVKIFVRPSPFIVELMAHELGHRYWYKSMTSTQRAKFEDLVKVRTRPKPRLENYAPDYLDMNKTIEDARKKVEAVVNEPRDVLAEFEKSRKPRMLAVDHFEQLLSDAAMHFNTDIFTAVQTKGTPDVSPAAKAAWQDLLKTVGDAFKHLFNVRVIEKKLNAYPDGPNDWNLIFKKERSYWVAEAADLLNVAEATARLYVSECVLGYNDKQKTFADDAIRQWQVEQDSITKPVLPVSDYGTSNIDEAFAEVFMFYVMDQKMNADQEASFKAVLLDKDRMASKVAERWAHVGSSGSCQSMRGCSSASR
jgi:hypothetical protein